MREFRRVLLVVLLSAWYGAIPVHAQATASVERWEPTIERFEAADVAAPVAPGGIVFVGSSSIVRWDALEDDFPSIPVLNRGFGGSDIEDVLHYADRIILPYRPRYVVVYAGENGLARGRSHEAIVEDYLALVERVLTALPEARMAWISMKPSPSRWHLADAMRSGNRMVEEFSARDPRLDYIDVFTPMLGPDGTPPPELFVADMLHMSPEGYAIWREVVGPFVER
jgi:lysophospholipase L1-like esterase